MKEGWEMDRPGMREGMEMGLPGERRGWIMGLPPGLAKKHATPPAQRMMIREKFKDEVRKGVHDAAMDKNTVMNNQDRVEKVVMSQDKRLDELLKAKRISFQDLINEINAAIHEILQIFQIPAHQGVQFGMFSRG
jgi:hypothetical protein